MLVNTDVLVEISLTGTLNQSVIYKLIQNFVISAIVIADIVE